MKYSSLLGRVFIFLLLTGASCLPLASSVSYSIARWHLKYSLAFDTWNEFTTFFDEARKSRVSGKREDIFGSFPATLMLCEVTESINRTMESRLEERG